MKTPLKVWSLFLQLVKDSHEPPFASSIFDI